MYGSGGTFPPRWQQHACLQEEQRGSVDDAGAVRGSAGGPALQRPVLPPSLEYVPHRPLAAPHKRQLRYLAAGEASQAQPHEEQAVSLGDGNACAHWRAGRARGGPAEHEPGLAHSACTQAGACNDV